MRTSLHVVVFTLLMNPLLASCSGDAGDPGALVDLRMESTVGVLLDELPAAERERAATALLAQPESFWRARAVRQVEATAYRLIYRNFFVDVGGQLPLPPREQWSIEASAPARRDIGGHDLVVVDYTFTSTLLSAADQPALAEPMLAEVGGVWDEVFALPVDPDLLLERTGYACMDEDGYPPNTADTENALALYDDTCEPGLGSCHLTEDPGISCVDALDQSVGRVDTAIRFERVAWDQARADAVRLGELQPGGPQLEALTQGVKDNRIVYRYFEDGSCALAEGCITGTGWRRLLQFTASMHNVGDEDMALGDVGPDSLAVANHLVSRSPCHDHMHFNHYGDFTLDTGTGELGSKRAFCLESTSRYSNTEGSPLVHDYGCDYQGTAAGWGDDYIAGLDCQWIDITPVVGPTSAPLIFEVNPDGFLCEGIMALDEQGQPMFEPTEFVDEAGDIESRFVCDARADAQADNIAMAPVDIPAEGGLVTGPCSRGQLGEKRACGLSKLDDTAVCTAGQSVTLACSVAAGEPAQVLRICETSAVLGHGIPCTFGDALASATITEAEVDVTFTCPAPRDVNEPGGGYATYVGPAIPGEAAATITCQ